MKQHQRRIDCILARVIDWVSPKYYELLLVLTPDRYAYQRVKWLVQDLHKYMYPSSDTWSVTMGEDHYHREAL